MAVGRVTRDRVGPYTVVVVCHGQVGCKSRTAAHYGRPVQVAIINSSPLFMEVGQLFTCDLIF